MYEGGAWYRSSVLRHVTTANDYIALSLSSIPGSGIKWYVSNVSTGAQIGSQVYLDNPNPGTSVQLATNVANGTTFYNNYAQDLSCNYRCGSYNFSGFEYY